MYRKMDILKHFLEDSEREFHIRELARIEKKSPMTITKELNKLKHENLLLFKPERNHYLYKANAENLKFRLLKLSYNLNKIYDSDLISYLENKFNHPEAIILFGSFRKAEDMPKSDIDILIINPSKKEINLTDFEKRLGHKIQLFVHSQKEIDVLKKKNPELLNNFINGIVLSGFFEVFK